MSRFTSASIVAVLCAVILSCDKSPTRPTPTPTNTPPTAAPATLLSIIAGPSSTRRPAKRRSSTRPAPCPTARRDVTGTVTWRTSDSASAISPTGLATMAGRAGTGLISRTRHHGVRRGRFSCFRPAVSCWPERFAKPAFQSAAPPSRCCSLSRLVLSATTDALGGYRLFGVGGDVEILARPRPVTASASTR